MLAIATVDPRESRGSNQRRRATTEHSEHTEVRKPEEEQTRNTQNTRKTENRKTGYHGIHRTHGSQKTGRRATTEHTEHTEVRQPEDEQPRNTRNTRKSGDQGRTANRRKGGVDRWKEVSCRRIAATEGRGDGKGPDCWGGKKKKPPLGNPRGGFKNPAIPTFALVCTIIGSESLTTVFGMGTGDPF